MGTRSLRNLSSTTQRRLKVAAALAGGAGLANDADAAINYVDIDPDETLVVGTFELDMDGDGTAEFIFEHAATSSLIGDAVIKPNSMDAAIAGFMGATSLYVTKAAQSAPISVPGGGGVTTSPTLDMTNILNGDVGIMIRSGTNPGGGALASSQFDLTESTYIAVKFTESGTGATAFGWIGVEILDTDSSRDNDFRITDFAYSTDMPIAAGQTTIPEPSALSLLALGAAGVASMRRRRRKDGDAGE